MHALGPEYESFRDHTFRQMDLVNERDENGNITRAGPTFDYIENKTIEGEHRKGQLSTPKTAVQILLALALIRGPGDKKLIPPSDGIHVVLELITFRIVHCAGNRTMWSLNASTRIRG